MTPEEGLSLGTYLRQEREKKNTSLESVAKITRIPLRNLEAMERDEFHLLPAPVFVRGFLRMYATQVGIDTEAVLALYEAQTDFSRVSPPKKIDLSPQKIRPLVKITLFALVFGILFYFIYERTPAPPLPPAPPPSPASPPSPAPPPSPASPPSPAPPLPPAPSVLEASRLPIPQGKTLFAEESPSPKKDPLETPSASLPPPPPSPDLGEEPKEEERRHVLKFTAKELTWLRIQPDDQKRVDVLLQPNETSTWTALRQFKITVGNAGGVEIFLDGVPQGHLGDSGQVVHLLLPKEAKKVTVEEGKEP